MDHLELSSSEPHSEFEGPNIFLWVTVDDGVGQIMESS